jgi:hypothetical protein
MDNLAGYVGSKVQPTPRGGGVELFWKMLDIYETKFRVITHHVAIPYEAI